MPGYEKIESLKNGGSWGQFCWKTCGFERVKCPFMSWCICEQWLVSGQESPQRNGQGCEKVQTVAKLWV